MSKNFGTYKEDLIRPVVRNLGGVVLFQEKVDLYKIENSMNMAGSGGMPPTKF